MSYYFCPPHFLDTLASTISLSHLARKVFGQEAVELAHERLHTPLTGWGYRQKDRSSFISTISYLLLKNRHPWLEEITFKLIEEVARTCPLPRVHRCLFQISRALCALGITERALPSRGERARMNPERRKQDGSISLEWTIWCERWYKHSTLQDRHKLYNIFLRVGRWLAAAHPEVRSPADWTYELCTEFVAAVMNLKCGEWASPESLTRLPAKKIGQPLRPNSKADLLKGVSVFFRDCQEWEWIPRHFNPNRVLRLPTSLRHLTGPDPKSIDRERWAKLLWAAMNLQVEDLPVGGNGNDLPPYPIELVRAIAVVWFFSALRANEIRRLRTGCVRWQYEYVKVPPTGEVLPRDATCFLEIPVTKTSMSYTKPVHPLVGKRIAEWERVRPQEQPSDLDHKTSETVQFLFSYRGSRFSDNYLNDTLIPLLCRRAGIPEEDSRGTITSHRARATIASMLYNAHEPLSIYELKEFLGHKYLTSTQHYLKVDPTQLASKVVKAGYLEQNLATVEVLLDQEAVMSGAASRGECWK